MNDKMKFLEYKEIIDSLQIYDLKSVIGQKEMAISLLCGENYRIKPEENVQSKLTANYIWIYERVKEAKSKYGESWREDLFDFLNKGKLNREEKNLKWWLMGLAEKTAKNIDLYDNKEEAKKFLKQQINNNANIISKTKTSLSSDDAWLMLMAGHATLNIRGSNKSSVGKSLEHSFLVALYSVLGLTLDVDFKVSIDGDEEVQRQYDAEIIGGRKNYLVDLGLIAEGNPEVITDKIYRVGRNGMVIFDKLSPKSTAWDVAREEGVNLVQIRNCNPLVDVHKYLLNLKVQSITDKLIKEVPTTRKDIEDAVLKLPDEIFQKIIDVAKTTT